MTASLLHIRIKQLKREIDGLSLYIIPIIAIAAYIVFVTFKEFQKGQNAFYIIIALSVLCLSIHFSRKDKTFVFKHLDNPHIQIFLEYVLLTLPFSITCMVTKSWYCYPLLLAILFCIPLFKFEFRQKTSFKKLSNIISAKNFEWLSGFRKQYALIIVLYILAIGFCWLKILPLFLLWFLTVTIVSFYTECESVQMLREGNKSPKQFLLSKLKACIIYVLILYTPIIIVNTLLNPDFLVLNLLFIPIQMSLLGFAICFKYSSYSPNKIKIGNNIPFSIVALGSALPHFLPVPTILFFIYFFRAENNLKQYLND
jgi:hypothetical protein